jgi:hypothetical protein
VRQASEKKKSVGLKNLTFVNRREGRGRGKHEAVAQETILNGFFFFHHRSNATWICMTSTARKAGRRHLLLYAGSLQPDDFCKHKIREKLKNQRERSTGEKVWETERDRK